MRALLAWVLLWVSWSSHAFQVEPMIQQLEPFGSNAQTQYRVENSTAEPLALEVVVMARDVLADSEEILTPAEQDFLVMPPQANISPGNFQSFRVRYLGDAPLQEVRSYRIIFKQLPLKYDNENSGVDLLFNFATLVFVSPPDAIQKLDVSIEPQGITLRNDGHSLINLNGSLAKLASQSQTSNLPWNEFGALSPANFLIPGQSVIIPFNQEWLDGQTIVSAELQLTN